MEKVINEVGGGRGKARTFRSLSYPRNSEPISKQLWVKYPQQQSIKIILMAVEKGAN